MRPYGQAVRVLHDNDTCVSRLFISDLHPSKSGQALWLSQAQSGHQLRLPLRQRI